MTAMLRYVEALNITVQYYMWSDLSQKVKPHSLGVNLSIVDTVELSAYLFKKSPSICIKQHLRNSLS